MHRRAILSWMAVICLTAFASADDPQPITPAEAINKVDETVLVRMEVKSAALSGSVGFLNSEKNYKDAGNFTIFLNAKVMSQFRDADIDDPAAHFKGKTIEVKGKVTKHRERPEIVLDGPKAIKIVKPDAKKPQQ